MADERKDQESAYREFTKDKTKLGKDSVKELADYTLKSNAAVIKDTLKAYTVFYNGLGKLHTTYITNQIQQEKNLQAALQKIRAGNNNINEELRAIRKTSEWYRNALNERQRQAIDSISTVTGVFEREIGQATENVTEDLTNNLNSVVKSFGAALSQVARTIWGELRDLFISGINDYMRAYENTFTEISSRTGFNYSDTRQLYSQGFKTIYANNVQNVVSMSDDMIPAMERAVRQGFQGDNLIAKAFNDSIAKYIMPWLDTSSEAFVNLSFNLSEYQMKALKGQQLQLQNTEAGNRLLQTGVIDSLLNEIAPTLVNVEYGVLKTEGIGKEYQAIMLNLTENEGWSTTEAYSYVKKLMEADKNPYRALESGDLFTKLYSINRNTLDKSVAQAAVDINNQSVGWVKNANGPYAQSVLISETGLPTRGDWYNTANEWDITQINDYLEKVNKDDDYFASIYEREADAAEEHLTVAKRIETRIGNLSGLIAKPLTAIPFAAALVSVLFKFLDKGNFGSKLIDNLSQELIGKLSSSSIIAGAKSAKATIFGGGIKSAITGAISANPAVFGIIGVAIVTAIGAWVIGPQGRKIFKDKIGDAIKSLFGNIPEILKDENTSLTYKISRVLTEAIAGVVKAPWKILSAIKSATFELMVKLFTDEKFRQDIIDRIKNFFTDIWNGVKDTAKDIIKLYIDDLTGKRDGLLGTNSTDSNKTASQALVEKTLGKNASEKVFSSDTSTSQKVAAGLGGVASAIGKFGAKIIGIDSALSIHKWAEENKRASHAGGLSYVPSDGYQATLHEGERVLTKSENTVYTKAIVANNAMAVEHNEQLISVVQEVSAAIMKTIRDTTQQSIDANAKNTQSTAQAYQNTIRMEKNTMQSHDFDSSVVSLSSNVLSTSLRNFRLSESR